MAKKRMEGNMPKLDRQDVLMLARAEVQKMLSNPAEKPEDWKELAEGMLMGVNDTLRANNFAPTDLEHLLPSFTSDPTLITYAQVMKEAR